MPELERTLVLVKPDGVARGIAGELIARFERRGIRLAALKLLRAPRALVEEHYAEHRSKGFFESVCDFLTSGPVVAAVLEGPGVVGIVRAMSGATNPADAAPGTIRGDYALVIDSNVLHTSADPDGAAREIGIWFRPQELV